MDYVLYHAHCPDGFGAAFAAWLCLKDRAVYLPVEYGKPPPEMPGLSDLYIVDFSYSRDIIAALEEECDQLILLDHHRTAIEELYGYQGRSTTKIWLDDNESGATLTWKWFHKDITMPLLFAYLRDRDLWRWELSSSKEISVAMRSYPYSFELWEGWLGSDTLYELRHEGSAILRHQDKMVAALCKQARWYRIGGYDIPAVNTSLYGSEVGNALCEDSGCVYDYPFAACFSLQKDGRWRWELRSIGDFDVSEVAKKYGGGGHKNAAGFLSDDPM